MIPMLTFWFASNHKPKLTDTGKSMRRRIKLVKFLNSVEIGKEDTGLADRIIANEGDILPPGRTGIPPAPRNHAPASANHSPHSRPLPGCLHGLWPRRAARQPWP